MPSFLSDQSDGTEGYPPRVLRHQSPNTNSEWTDKTWYPGDTLYTSGTTGRPPSSHATSGASGAIRDVNQAEIDAFLKCYQESDGRYDRLARKEMFDNLSLKLLDMGLHMSSEGKKRLAAVYLQKPRPWPRYGEGEDAILRAVIDWQWKVDHATSDPK